MRSIKAVNDTLPGQPAMWFFVVGDLWIFTCYFACYVFDQSRNPEHYLWGQSHLSQSFGVLNTIILLTSSLLIALCVQSLRSNRMQMANRYLYIGAGLGIVFLCVKAYEWGIKIDDGIPSSLTDFFLYYFVFTGLHFFHVCLGLLILYFVWVEINKKAKPNMNFIEGGAVYWHMVDLLWIIIFALLYLIR